MMWNVDRKTDRRTTYRWKTNAKWWQKLTLPIWFNKLFNSFFTVFKIAKDNSGSFPWKAMFQKNRTNSILWVSLVCQFQVFQAYAWIGHATCHCFCYHWFVDYVFIRCNTLCVVKWEDIPACILKSVHTQLMKTFSIL